MKLFRKSFPVFYIVGLLFSFSSCDTNSTGQIKNAGSNTTVKEKDEADTIKDMAFDTADYNKRMLEIANGDTTGKWPAKAPYPLPGAIFPFNRVVAFYGNLY